MLQTSIFSFSHNVFYPSQNKFQFFFCLILFCRLQILSISTSLKICRLVNTGKKIQVRLDYRTLRLIFERRKYPFHSRPILDSSKLKEFADDNSVFDEDGRKISKQVESNVGKGEIARYEQFLLFPHCFQKTYTTDT